MYWNRETIISSAPVELHDVARTLLLTYKLTALSVFPACNHGVHCFTRQKLYWVFKMNEQETEGDKWWSIRKATKKRSSCAY